MDATSKVPLKSKEYQSSNDDFFGVQKNWFTSLYKQLNYFAKAGIVPGLKGRQKEVFESVEREFEGLYKRHVVGSGLTGMEHRAMLMMCLAIATHRILSNELPDPTLVREVIRTNQGSLMMGLLMPLHRLRIWILRHLLGEDPYRQAVRLLPALQSDMGTLCTGEVQTETEAPAPGPGGGTTAAAAAAATSLVIRGCRYHEVLTQEDAPFLLSEFCCNHGLVWLNEFRRHGVDVTLDRCKVWDDDCCSIRLAKMKSPGS